MTSASALAAQAALAQGLHQSQWAVAEATQWYARQGWLVGCNFVSSNAVNQLEMWQADSFDVHRIDRELGLAANIGINAIRVFLHDLLWQQDANGFAQRIEKLLGLAANHDIRTIFVLFDSCWNPHPKSGPQNPPVPGVHNSQWVQSPGAEALNDRSQYPRLEAYVRGVMETFSQDPRILSWDLWNEPDNLAPAGCSELDATVKRQLVLDLLPKVFAWARRAGAIQPLTSGVWDGDWQNDGVLNPIQRVQLNQSDIISFHHYGWPEDFEKRVQFLQRYGRPVLCTEYMARPLGSTFDLIAPLAKSLNVAALNWGLVAGKTQTWLPWDSWQHPYVADTPLTWFHDVFHADGMPYRLREVEIISQLAGKPAHSSSLETLKDK